MRTFDFILFGFGMAFMACVAFGTWSLIPSRQERRNTKLRLKLEELRLRDELLRYEGRDSETTRRP